MNEFKGCKGINKCQVYQKNIPKIVNQYFMYTYF